MSTNYYCAWPGGFEADGALWRNEIVLHIGKTGGGHVSLQGHTRFGWSDRPYEWREITSWSDWLATLDERPGWVLYDEYQRVMTLDELRERIENSTREERRSQYEWTLRNPEYVQPGDYWLDDQQFSMSLREFS